MKELSKPCGETGRWRNKFTTCKLQLSERHSQTVIHTHRISNIHIEAEELIEDLCILAEAGI